MWGGDFVWIATQSCGLSDCPQELWYRDEAPFYLTQPLILLGWNWAIIYFSHRRGSIFHFFDKRRGGRRRQPCHAYRTAIAPGPGSGVDRVVQQRIKRCGIYDRLEGEEGRKIIISHTRHHFGNREINSGRYVLWAKFR